MAHTRPMVKPLAKRWAIDEELLAENPLTLDTAPDETRERAVREGLRRAGGPKKPYGDVTYADPGYQEDGKARYPIDSYDHVKSAWSYINQQQNAANYTPEQLARIKKRIKKAGKRFGIEFADDEMERGARVPDQYVRASELPQLLRTYLRPYRRPREPRPRPGVPERLARSVLDALTPPDDPSRLSRRAAQVFDTLAELDDLYQSGWERRAFNPDDHPRWPKGTPKIGGKFRPGLASAIMDALESMTGGAKGSDIPDPFHGIGDDELREVAKARKVRIPKSASRDDVVKKLLGSIGRKPPVARGSRNPDAVHASLVKGKQATLKPDAVDGLMTKIKSDGTVFNLSNLQITGKGNENLFRRHLRDRPRETMPQLPTGFGDEGKTSSGRYMEDFEKFLQSKGVKFEYGTMDPRELVASQSELSGPKVAKLYGFMRADGWKPGGVMIVARTGEGKDEWAVVDGHHRWAGAAAASIARGGTLDVTVMRLDADIDEVLGTPEAPENGIVMDFAAFEGLAEDREG